MVDQYYYREIDGREIGPVSEKAIRHLFANKLLALTTLVRVDGDSTWRTADEAGLVVGSARAIPAAQAVPQHPAALRTEDLSQTVFKKPVEPKSSGLRTIVALSIILLGLVFFWAKNKSESTHSPRNSQVTFTSSHGKTELGVAVQLRGEYVYAHTADEGHTFVFSVRDADKRSKPLLNKYEMIVLSDFEALIASKGVPHIPGEDKDGLPVDCQFRGAATLSIGSIEEKTRDVYGGDGEKETILVGSLVAVDEISLPKLMPDCISGTDNLKDAQPNNSREATTGDEFPSNLGAYTAVFTESASAPGIMTVPFVKNTLRRLVPGKLKAAVSHENWTTSGVEHTAEWTRFSMCKPNDCGALHLDVFLNQEQHMIALVTDMTSLSTDQVQQLQKENIKDMGMTYISCFSTGPGMKDFERAWLTPILEGNYLMDYEYTSSGQATSDLLLKDCTVVK